MSPGDRKNGNAEKKPDRLWGAAVQLAAVVFWQVEQQVALKLQLLLKVWGETAAMLACLQLHRTASSGLPRKRITSSGVCQGFFIEVLLIRFLAPFSSLIIKLLGPFVNIY
jgi:hypothetical protein